MVLACVITIATMVPFISNGLGLREWAIGLATPLLPGATATLQLGLANELVNRAVEILIITLLGSIAMAWLARRRRGGGNETRERSMHT